MTENPKPSTTPWYRRIKPWQFSLRTLLLLMAVASGVCWYYLLPKRHDEKLADGHLILKREYRGKGEYFVHKSNPGPGPGLAFDGYNDGYWRLSDFQGRLLVNGNYRKGQEQGWWTTYHPSGRLAAQGKMSGGERTGVWKTWSPAGQLLSEVTYAAKPVALLQGPAQFWHDNGKPSAAGAYDQNQRIGKWQEWNDKGDLIAAGEYLQGKKHGAWQEVSAATKQQVEQNYVAGLRKELLDEHLKTLSQRIEQGDISERLTLISVASEFGPSALPILEKLASETSNRYVQLAAIGAVGKCSGQMQPQLTSLAEIAALDDPQLATAARWEMYRHFPKERSKLLPLVLRDVEQLADEAWDEGLNQLREMFVLEPSQRPEIFAVVLQVSAKHLPGPNGCFVGLARQASGPEVVARWHIDVIPHLDQGLNHSDPRVRVAVVCLIRQLLSEKNDLEYPRGPGAVMAPRWKIPAALAPLIERVRNDADPAVAEEAKTVDDPYRGAGGLGGGGGIF